MNNNINIKTISRRFFALILTLYLLIPTLPLTAYTDNVQIIDSVNYANDELIANTNANQNIIMNDSLSLANANLPITPLSLEDFTALIAETVGLTSDLAPAVWIKR